MARHKGLQSLILNAVPVTDARLKKLAPLTDLRTLGVQAKVTDAGLKEMARFKRLEYFTWAPRL